MSEGWQRYLIEALLIYSLGTFFFFLPAASAAGAISEHAILA
jgi:hypothetical protein